MMRRHFTALLISSLTIALTASAAAAQSARDTLVEVKIERKTPVFGSPSFAANTIIMAPAGQFTMPALVVENGFIRVPLRSIKASLPASYGWITGGEVSARVVRVRADTVTVTRADTVLRTRVDSVTVDAHPKDHRE
jgi:hypothetical protein